MFLIRWRDERDDGLALREAPRYGMIGRVGHSRRFHISNCITFPVAGVADCPSLTAATNCNVARADAITWEP
jgi:hypothetical protein